MLILLLGAFDPVVIGREELEIYLLEILSIHSNCVILKSKLLLFCISRNIVIAVFHYLSNSKDPVDGPLPMY